MKKNLFLSLALLTLVPVFGMCTPWHAKILFDLTTEKKFSNASRISAAEEFRKKNLVHFLTSNDLKLFEAAEASLGLTICKKR